MIANKYFLSNSIPRDEQKDMLPMVFMPLIVMEKEEYKKMVDNDVQCLYEEWSKAGPRSINGYPMFMSMGMLTREDCRRAFDIVNKLKAAMGEVLGSLKEEAPVPGPLETAPK